MTRWPLLLLCLAACAEPVDPVRQDITVLDGDTLIFEGVLIKLA